MAEPDGPTTIDPSEVVVEAGAPASSPANLAHAGRPATDPNVVDGDNERWVLNTKESMFALSGAPPRAFPPGPPPPPGAAWKRGTDQGAPLEVYTMDDHPCATLAAGIGEMADQVRSWVIRAEEAAGAKTSPPLERTVQAQVYGEADNGFAPRWQFGSGASWVLSQDDASMAAAPRKLPPKARCVLFASSAEDALAAYAGLALAAADNGNFGTQVSLLGLGLAEMASGRTGSQMDRPVDEDIKENTRKIQGVRITQALTGVLDPTSYRLFAYLFVQFVVEKHGAEALLKLARQPVSLHKQGPEGITPELSTAFMSALGSDLSQVESQFQEQVLSSDVSDFLRKLDSRGLQQTERSTGGEAWTAVALKDDDNEKKTVEVVDEKPVYTSINARKWCLDVLPRGQDGKIAAPQFNANILAKWTCTWMWRNERKRVYLCALWVVLQVAYTVGTPFVIRRVFDVYIPNEDYGGIGLMVAILIVGSLVKAQAVYGLRVHSPAGAKFLPPMHFDLVKHVCAAQQLILDGHDLSHLMATMDNALPVVNGCIDSLLDIILNFSEFCFLLITLFLMSWTLTLCIAFCAPFYAAYAVKKGPELEVANKAVGDHAKFAFGHVEENLRATSSKRLFGLWDVLEGDIYGEELKWTAAFKNFYRVWAENKRGLNFLELLISLVVLAAGAFLVADSQVKIGAFISFYVASQKVNSLLSALTTKYRAFNMGTVALRRLIPLLGTLEDQYDRTSVLQPKQRYDIDVNGVNLSYGERNVLKYMKAHIPEGSKVGILGRSGVGKSSLLKVMSRLYQPTMGEVLVGGIPLNTIDVPKVIATMEQDSLIFNRSVRDNVTIGGEFSDDAVERALTVAEIWEDIQKLDKVLDTPCGYMGKMFSGGQRQRLSLARTVVRNTPLVILDEPVASQEVTNVVRIGRNLKDLTWKDSDGQDRPVTLLAVTHSLALVDDWDYMLMVADGHVAEFGPAADLMAANGKYAALVQSMSGLTIGKGGKVVVAPDRIAGFWMFSALSIDSLSQIAEEFQTRKLGDREKLFEMDTDRDSMVMLVDGCVEELEKDPEKEGAFKRKCLWMSGDSQGADSLVRSLLAHPEDVLDMWPTSGQATTKGTVAVTLTQEAFEELLDSDEQLNENVREMVSHVDSARSADGMEMIWLFQGLPEDSLKYLGRQFQIEVADKGIQLFNPEEDPITSLYVLVSGAVHIVTDFYPKRDNRTAYSAGLVPRCSFGERALFTGTAGRTFKGTATQRSVLLILREKGLLAFKDKYPGAYDMVQDMIELEKSSRSIEELRNNWLLAIAPKPIISTVAEILSASVLAMPEGTVLDPDAMTMVLKGEVLAGYETPDGVTHNVTHGPGSYINEVALLGDSATFGVKINNLETSRKSVLLQCPRGTLHKLLEQEKNMAGLKPMQALALRVKQLRTDAGQKSLGLAGFKRDQQNYTTLAWQLQTVKKGAKVPELAKDQFLAHVVCGSVDVADAGSRADPSKPLSDGATFWTAGAANMIKTGDIKKKHASAVSMARGSTLSDAHTVVVLMDLSELSEEAEERRRMAQEATRAEQMLRNELRVESAELYKKVVSSERRLGLRAHFDGRREWRRAMTLYKSAIALGMVDKSMLHQASRESASQMQDYVDILKERVAQLDPVVDDRLAHLLTTLAEWRKMGMRKSKIVLWADRLMAKVRDGSLPAPKSWGAIPSSSPAVPSSEGTPSRDGGSPTRGELLTEVAQLQVVGLRGDDGGEPEGEEDPGRPVDATVWKELKASDRDREEYDLSLGRLEEMDAATERLRAMREAQLKRRRDALGELWDLLSAPQDYRDLVLTRAQVAEPVVFVYLDREVAEWNLKLRPIIEKVRGEMGDLWERLITPDAERQPWLAPGDLEGPTMSLLREYEGERDRLTELVRVVEPVVQRLASRGQEGLVANIDSLYHSRINDLRRQARLGSSDIPMEVMRDWTISECRTELEEMQTIVDNLQQP